MISAHTVSVKTLESLAERRFLKRRRCGIPTLVQVVGAERQGLYRAIIHDISVSGLGLVTHTPLPLGRAARANGRRDYRCIDGCGWPTETNPSLNAFSSPSACMSKRLRRLPTC
jgi:hypothetical protein